MAGLPGGIGLSEVSVYDWDAADGLCGGSPHLHLASAEAYLVRSGRGEVHTITAEGPRRHALAAGDLLWFTPGTVHRLVTTDDLRLTVLMQNAGLPEEGDAVLTFPAEVLDDPAAYLQAVTLPSDPGLREAAARARRDLAIEGYLRLLADLEERGTAALQDLYRRAVALVAPRVEGWRHTWESTVLAEVEATRERLDGLAAGDASHLLRASLTRAERSGGTGHGMCGRLTTWSGPGPHADAGTSGGSTRA